MGPEQCTGVKMMVFANKSMATRSNLEREVQNWLAACGTAPPGNGAERALWQGAAYVSVDPSLMSADELAEYEDKKLKMKKVGGRWGAVEGLSDLCAPGGTRACVHFMMVCVSTAVQDPGWRTPRCWAG